MISPPNPMEVPAVTYKHLICLTVRGCFFTARSTEGLGATVRENTLGTVYHWLWPKVLDMIDSIQRQMVGEPYTLYRIRPHHSRLKRRGAPT
jgi:hypothetical protein